MYEVPRYIWPSQGSRCPLNRRKAPRFRPRCALSWHPGWCTQVLFCASLGPWEIGHSLAGPPFQCWFSGSSQKSERVKDLGSHSVTPSCPRRRTTATYGHHGHCGHELARACLIRRAITLVLSLVFVSKSPRKEIDTHLSTYFTWEGAARPYQFSSSLASSFPCPSHVLPMSVQ